VLWLTLPLVGLLAGAAPSVVLVLLGEQWHEVTSVFQLLCVTAALQPLYSTIGWIFVSRGETDRFLRWAMVSTPLFVISFAIGLPWGPVGVALSYSAAFVLMLPWTMAYATRGTVIRLADLLKAWRQPVAVALALFLACVAVEAMDLGPPATLSVCVAGTGVLVGALLTLQRDLRDRLKLLLGAATASPRSLSA
jgi:PST family polysaccharide transporter